MASDPEHRCWILMPRIDSVIGANRGLTECDRPAGHTGPHSFVYPAHSGLLDNAIPAQRWEWEDDTECGCCEPDEDGRCFVFASQAPKIAYEGPNDITKDQTI